MYKYTEKELDKKKDTEYECEKVSDGQGDRWRFMEGHAEEGRARPAWRGGGDACHVHQPDNIHLFLPSSIFFTSRHWHARALVRVVCTRAFSGTHILSERRVTEHLFAPYLQRLIITCSAPRISTRLHDVLVLTMGPHIPVSGRIR